MNEKIIANILSVVKSGDEIYHLGDLASKRYYLDHFFDRLPFDVKFHWIIGNHDRGWENFKKRCTSTSFLKDIKVNGNPITLCHYPMLTWNKSHYGAWMLYGHHHKNSHGSKEIEKLARGKMLNVNVEFNDYKPYSEKDIENIMNGKPDNWDLIKR